MKKTKIKKNVKKDQKTWFFVSFTFIFHSLVSHSVSFSRFDTNKGLSDYLIKIFRQPARRCGTKYTGLLNSLSLRKVEKLRIIQLKLNGKTDTMVKLKKQLQKDCYFIYNGIS